VGCHLIGICRIVFFKTAGGKYLALVGLFLVSDCTGGAMGLLWWYGDTQIQGLGVVKIL